MNLAELRSGDQNTENPLVREDPEGKSLHSVVQALCNFKIQMPSFHAFLKGMFLLLMR